MSPTAIAKMMRDTEVPTASGLRSSIPRATPVPTVAPDVPALFNEAASGTEESDTSVRKERARDLHDLQNRSTPPASPLEAAPTAPATETWSAPQRPAAAFPEWIQTTTRDAEERESAEERQLVIRRAVIAGVYAVLAGLIVWWFLAH